MKSSGRHAQARKVLLAVLTPLYRVAFSRLTPRDAEYHELGAVAKHLERIADAARAARETFAELGDAAADAKRAGRWDAYDTLGELEQQAYQLWQAIEQRGEILRGELCGELGSGNPGGNDTGGDAA